MAKKAEAEKVEKAAKGREKNKNFAERTAGWIFE